MLIFYCFFSCVKAWRVTCGSACLHVHLSKASIHSPFKEKKNIVFYLLFFSPEWRESAKSAADLVCFIIILFNVLSTAPKHWSHLLARYVIRTLSFFFFPSWKPLDSQRPVKTAQVLNSQLDCCITLPWVMPWEGRSEYPTTTHGIMAALHKSHMSTPSHLQFKCSPTHNWIHCSRISLFEPQLHNSTVYSLMVEWVLLKCSISHRVKAPPRRRLLDISHPVSRSVDQNSTASFPKECCIIIRWLSHWGCHHILKKEKFTNI